MLIGTRFSDREELRNQTGDFLALAREHLKKDIDNLELDTIKACILVGNTFGHEGHYDLESLYFGTLVSSNNTSLKN